MCCANTEIGVEPIPVRLQSLVKNGKYLFRSWLAEIVE